MQLCIKNTLSYKCKFLRVSLKYYIVHFIVVFLFFLTMVSCSFNFALNIAENKYFAQQGSKPDGVVFIIQGNSLNCYQLKLHESQQYFGWSFIR